MHTRRYVTGKVHLCRIMHDLHVFITNMGQYERFYNILCQLLHRVYIFRVQGKVVVCFIVSSMKKHELSRSVLDKHGRFLFSNNQHCVFVTCEDCLVFLCMCQVQVTGQFGIGIFDPLNVDIIWEGYMIDNIQDRLHRVELKVDWLFL